VITGPASNLSNAFTAVANWAKIEVCDCRFQKSALPLLRGVDLVMERSAADPGVHEFVLSNLSPSVAQRRLALGVVLVLLVVFVIVAGPLSTLPLTQIHAFIPAYGTAIFVTDSITAALLFAQFSVLRSRALLALANGYLLTALFAVPWTLTFPGVFAPGGGLGAGLQSTVWLYVLSHAGFALFAIIYTLLKDADPIEWLSPRSVRAAIMASVGSVTALVCCATVLVTAGRPILPPSCSTRCAVPIPGSMRSDPWRHWSSLRLSCYG
jgi:hypothetical protein